MKHYTWDEEKNKKLIDERHISFEEVVFFIEKGNLLDVLDHPNREKYNNQRMFVVRIGDYAYLVPYVEDKDEVFLKTIIPSRKTTERYFGSSCYCQYCR